MDSADRRGLRFAETSQQASVADVNASHTYKYTCVCVYLCAFACILITRLMFVSVLNTYVYVYV